MIIEFLKGSLPWSNIENKEDVGRRKLELDSLDLVAGLPDEVAMFMEHLHTLSYQDKPNYDYIADLMNTIMEKNNNSEDEPYDWEKTGESTAAPISPAVQKRRSNATPATGTPGDQNATEEEPVRKTKRPSTAGARRGKPEPGSGEAPRPKTKRTSRQRKGLAVEENVLNMSTEQPEGRVTPQQNISRGSPQNIVAEGAGGEAATAAEARPAAPIPGEKQNPENPPNPKETGDAGGGCRCVVM